MSWMIASGLRFGRLVIAAAIGLLVLGVVQLRGATVDAFPEFMPPSVQVQTEALGLSGAEVEQLVTVPLEQDLLNGVPWLDHIHSRSEPGLSVIDIVFEQGTDIYAARQMVQERLTQAHALPNVGSPPIMIEPIASAGRVAMVGLSSSSVPLIDMSVLARWKIKPKLMGIPGVANVAIYGQRDRQLQVQVDPQRLAAQGVSLTQVIETAGNALWVSPLTFVEASTPGTGGFVEGSNQRLAVQHVLPITTAANLAQVPVEGAKAGSLRLGEVAQVVEDHQPLIGDAVGSGDPTLYLVIQKFPDANTREVAAAVDAAMKDLAPGMAGISVDTSVYRPSAYLTEALRGVGWAALAGLVLLLALLLALFSGWRSAVIALVAVPVPLVAAALVMDLTGRTLTTMTLAGLAVALALVVDDALGDLDAVRRRLRERAEEGAPADAPIAGTVMLAVRRSRQTMLYATAVVALAAAPFLVLGPVTTAFTRDLALGFALAVLASLLVALTLTPTLAVLLLRAGDARPGWFERSVGSRLEPAVGRVALRPAAGWAVAGVLAVAAFAAVPQVGARAFLPELRDRDLLVEVTTAPGTSLPETTRITDRMAAELRGVPGVAKVGAHVGRAVTSDSVGDVSAAEIWLTLSEGAGWTAARDRIAAVVAGYPGVRSRVQNYDADRVAAALAGASDDVVVRLYGQDVAAMKATADQVRDRISRVGGIRDARVRTAPMQPTARVEVDLAAADRYGLRPGDVRREATTLVSGLTVGNLYEQAKVFDVVVLGTPAARANLTGLADVRIGTPSGDQVRLGDVARVTVRAEPASIIHDQVQRSVDVVASIQGRGAAAVAADVRRAVDDVAMPPETHLQVLGAATVRQADLRRVLVWTLAAVLLALLVLQAAVGSWRRAALLTLLVPLGVTGGVLSAPLVGGVATAGGVAGLFAVLALTVRSSLVLTRRMVELEQVDGLAPGLLAAATAARERVVPVLRTALAVAVLLLPAALLGDRAGLEVLRPFAVTVLGGLVSSVLLTLFVLPAVCGLAHPPRRSAEPAAAVPEQAGQPAAARA